MTRPDAASRTPAGPPVPWAVAAAAGLAFFLAEHDLGASQRDEYYGVDTDALEAAAGSGQWGNRVGFTLLALAGGASLLGADRRWRSRGAMPWLLIALAGWSVASLLWAADPGRTVRRLASFTFCLAGAVGIARRLDGRQLCWFVLALTTGFTTLGVLTEVGLGTFRLFGEGRFAGTLHPNGQGANCSFLCLAAVALLPTEHRHRRLLVVLLVGGAALLLATKSRTALGAMLAGLVAAWLARPSARAVATGLAAAWLAAAGAFAAHLAGVDLARAAGGAVNMGRIEDAGTLSGRTELWEVLDGYTGQRPWLGYGYGGFWTPARIEAVSGDQSWGISSAHSAYYEAALGVGRVGLGLLGLSLAAGLWRAAADYRATADPGAGLLVSLLAAGVVQGFNESDLAMPTFPTFLLACALSRVAFFASDATDRHTPAGDIS